MAEQSPSSPPQDGSSGNESVDKLVLQAPQPMREDYIQNAVNFLSHPRVKGSPVFQRRAFLEKKNLTKEEIDEAFRRVPDPQPNSTDAAAIGSQQVNNPPPSLMQPYKAVQSPQAATGSITAGPVVTLTKESSWVNLLLGAGLFLGIGASTAIAVKKLFIPRLKSWTRRVVAEGDENVNDEFNSKFYEEIKEAVKVSVSSVSDIARTNQELLASKDEDRKILMKLTEALDAQANVLKSLSEIVSRNRENRFSQYNMLEEHVQPTPWNGPIDNHWRASHANVYTMPPNSGFDSGRHSFMPSSAEPTYGSFPGSYTERVQRPGYGYQPQTSNDRSNLVVQGGYQGGSSSSFPHAGNTIGSPAAAVPESPFQRRWVPPQAPGVIMPEAATAIRQPRSLPRQQSQTSDGHLSADAPRPSEPAEVAREQVNVNGDAPAGELPSGTTTSSSTGTANTANEGISGSEERQHEEA